MYADIRADVETLRLYLCTAHTVEERDELSSRRDVRRILQHSCVSVLERFRDGPVHNGIVLQSV